LLDVDIQPERDLWPEIAAGIAQPPVMSMAQRFAVQAAAILILVGASSGLTYLAMTDGGSAVSPVAQRAQLVFEPVSGDFGSQYTLGPGFQDARSVLVSHLEDEVARLSPAARGDVHKNLTTIRVAIADINKALANEPDNALLQKLLLSSYQEELSVMKKVNGITNAVMFREDM
jgi:hypothetical protein